MKIDYGHNRSSVSRCRSSLLTLAAVIIVSGAFLTYRSQIPAAIMLNYREKRALSYCCDPELIVYDYNPRSFSSSMTSLSGRSVIGDSTDRSFVPDVLKAIDRYSGQSFPRGILFVHGRAVPKDSQRLIVVGLKHADDGFAFGNVIFRRIQIKWSVIDCGFSFPHAGQGPQLRVVAGGDGPTVPLDESDRLSFYGGQTDSDDDSRFTIRYCLNQHFGEIDGWLRADSSVAIRIRSGPLLSREGPYLLRAKK